MRNQSRPTQQKNEIPLIGDVPESPTEGDVIVCSNCGRTIGLLIQEGDIWYIKIEGVLLRYGHGRCSYCLRTWHYDSNQIRLNLLVRRAIINRTIK